MGIQNHPKTATGHTPFSLAYGSEAMIPVETEVPSHRRIHFDQNENEKLQLEALDLLDERREEARLRIAAHQQRIADTSIPKFVSAALKLGT